MPTDTRQTPILIAVGGGKGGIGKSVVTLLVGQWLARMGHRTTVVDLDFSGANLHTLLGISDVPTSIHDHMNRRAASLEAVAVALDPPGFRVICGASEVLSAANPVFARKLKLMRGLFALDSEFVVLDLGAGTGFNVLDFFLVSDLQVLLTTAEPTSICNAYAFLRNSVFRRLSQLTRNQPALHEIIGRAMESYGSDGFRSMADLHLALEQFGGAELADPIRSELAQIRPLVLVNRVQTERDRNTSRVLEQVAAKYLGLTLEPLGALSEDPELRRMVARMVPLTRGHLYRGAFEEARAIAQRLAARAERLGLRPAGQTSPDTMTNGRSAPQADPQTGPEPALSRIAVTGPGAADRPQLS